MNSYFFDTEVYQNFFCVTFYRRNDNLDIHVFIIYDKQDDRDKLKEFLKHPKTLIGYNNIHYDNVILNAVCRGDTLEQIYEISKEIISGVKNGQASILKWQKVNYKSIDLMKIMAFDTMGMGLKQVSINLKWYRVQELPIPFDAKIKPEDIDIMLDYNLNDVLILKEFYRAIEDEVLLRKDISKTFNVDVTSASRSRMGNILIEKMYREKTGLHPDRFKEGRTNPIKGMVHVNRCIGKNIYFQTTELNSILSELKKLKLFEEYKFRFKKQVHFGGKTFDIGVGGLHSKDDPGEFRSNDQTVIIDVDVDSFYPWIMIYNKIKAAHLEPCFMEILETITQERMEAKKDGDKIKAGALKITINSIFGKLRSEAFWLYDPQAFYSVTISGQLYLLMLIERLHLAGFTILSANTDGIICQVNRKELNQYYEVCKQWMTETKFSLSYAEYQLYVRRDVNSYLAQKENGKVKMKGIFDTEPSLYQGYKYPIVAQALRAYYTNGTPIAETVDNATDIYDFLISQKCSKQFSLVHTQDGKVQRATRFYATEQGGYLTKIAKKVKGASWDDSELEEIAEGLLNEFYKSKGAYKEISLCSERVKILNDVPEEPIDYFNINRFFYIHEATKIVNKIKPKAKNISLF